MQADILNCIRGGKIIRFKHGSDTVIKARNGVIVWYKKKGNKIFLLQVYRRNAKS